MGRLDQGHLHPLLGRPEASTLAKSEQLMLLLFGASTIPQYLRLPTGLEVLVKWKRHEDVFSSFLSCGQQTFLNFEKLFRILPYL
jgi:hypothetical protein